MRAFSVCLHVNLEKLSDEKAGGGKYSSLVSDCEPYQILIYGKMDQTRGPGRCNEIEETFAKQVRLHCATLRFNWEAIMLLC